MVASEARVFRTPEGAIRITSTIKSKTSISPDVDLVTSWYHDELNLNEVDTDIALIEDNNIKSTGRRCRCESRIERDHEQAKGWNVTLTIHDVTNYQNGCYRCIVRDALNNNEKATVCAEITTELNITGKCVIHRRVDFQ